MAMDEENPKKLSDLFNEGWELFQKINDSNEASSSLQDRITECIKILVRCTHMVNLLALFSSNELIDEHSTENIRFLLLPAFLGELFLKAINDDRKASVQNSKIYFQDFLKRCNEQKIIEKDLSSYFPSCCEAEEKVEKKTLDEMNKDRQDKIEIYKQSKELHKKITILQKRLKEDPQSVDDDQTRTFYLDWLKLWINNAIENIISINSELEILEHMSKIQQGVVKPPDPKPKLKPLKPVLITREMLKNQVFGAGYKNLPTMTEDEYFEKELREGKIVMDYDSQKKNKTEEEHQEDKAEEKDAVEDRDDQEELEKARALDDWKDTHRRGDGNKERNG